MQHWVVVPGEVKNITTAKPLPTALDSSHLLEDSGKELGGG
jgi:hypothetical protein